MNAGKCPQNCVRTFSGICRSHMTNESGHDLQIILWHLGRAGGSDNTAGEGIVFILTINTSLLYFHMPTRKFSRDCTRGLAGETMEQNLWSELYVKGETNEGREYSKMFVCILPVKTNFHKSFRTKVHLLLLTWLVLVSHCNFADLKKTKHFT